VNIWYLVHAKKCQLKHYNLLILLHFLRSSAAAAAKDYFHLGKHTSLMTDAEATITWQTQHVLTR